MGVEFRTIRELYEITLDGSQIEKDSKFCANCGKQMQ